MEIAEVDEEEEREIKRRSIVQEEERPNSSAGSHTSQKRPSSPETPVVLDPGKIDSAPQETTFSESQEPPDFNGVVPVSKSSSEFERRLSSQTARPDLYSHAYGKQKVKLGPRPSTDTHNKRPQTAGNFRPTAALPSGFKLSKSAKKGKSDLENSRLAIPGLHAPILEDPSQEIDIVNTPLPPRPNTSSGASILSSASTIMGGSGKDSKMTPEKARLMKAMKLREKKKKMAATTSLTTQDSAVSVPKPTAGDNAGAAKDGHSENAPQAKEADAEQQDISHADVNGVDDLPTPSTVRTTTRSVDTCTDSHPTSPAAGSLSDVGESTKASSLSESTDETVQLEKPVEPQPEPESETSSGQESRDDNDDSKPLEDSTTTSVDLAEIAVNEAESPEEPELVSSELIGAVVLDEDEAVKTQSESTAAAATVKDADPSSDLAVAGDDVQAAPVVTEEPRVHGPASNSVVGKEELVAADTGAIRNTEITVPPRKGDDGPLPSPRVIPTSKFSTAEPKTPSTPRSPTTPSLKSKFSLHEASARPPLIAGPHDASIDETPSTSDALPNDNAWPRSPPLAAPPKSAKRKTKTAPVEPIKTDSTPKQTPQSEISDPLLDDEALMDELQTATFEEARPVMVSKSPMTPAFPTHVSASPPKHDQPDPSHDENSTPPLGRTVSNPMRGPYLAPGDVSSSSARSVSAGGAAYLHTVTRQASNAGLQSKKSGLGSSISQRIKALEKMSTTPGGPEPQRNRSATPSSTFHGVRNSTVRQPSKSPSVVDRASSLSRQSPTPEPSRSGTPETPEPPRRDRSGSMANRLSMFEAPTNNPPRGRPESVQVTARIIRDAPQGFPGQQESVGRDSSRGPTELKESPLQIDVQNAKPSTSAGIVTESPASPVAHGTGEALQEKRLSGERFGSQDERKNRRSSVDLVRNFLNTKSSESMSGATSPSSSVVSPTVGSFSGRDATLSPMRTNSGLSEGDDLKGANDKKGPNRTSRFMRRLSNSLAHRNKGAATAASPSVPENTKTKGAAASEAQVGIAADMGEVNVQFPENLLWKRRSMCLDTQGYLVLSAEQASATNSHKENAGPGVKRYHMSEFRRPYAPDVEVQELPNSVVLDLVEGSCLQVACEDRRAQTSVLQGTSATHVTLCRDDVPALTVDTCSAPRSAPEPPRGKAQLISSHFDAP